MEESAFSLSNSLVAQRLCITAAHAERKNLNFQLYLLLSVIALLTYGNKRSLHRTNWCQLWLTGSYLNQPNSEMIASIDQ